jgi:hypothetical protein
VEEELDLPGWTGKAQDLCGPERKRRIREMRQDGGVKYFDVTPVMSGTGTVTGAGFVGLCYVALRAVFRQIVPNRVIKYQ